MKTNWSGRLAHIHIATSASYEMEELAEAKLVAGRGIEGDRYFFGTGTYSPKPGVRDVTLIEMEVLETLEQGEPKMPGIKVRLAPEDHRRNLTTVGVPLNHLVGRRFRVGETVLYGARLNFPCKYIEELLGIPRLYEPLRPKLCHRGRRNDPAWRSNRAAGELSDGKPQAHHEDEGCADPGRAR